MAVSEQQHPLLKWSENTLMQQSHVAGSVRAASITHWRKKDIKTHKLNENKWQLFVMWWADIHLLRATVALVTGKTPPTLHSLSCRCQILTGLHNQRVGGGVEGQEWWLLLCCSLHLFFAPHNTHPRASLSPLPPYFFLSTLSILSLAKPLFLIFPLGSEGNLFFSLSHCLLHSASLFFNLPSGPWVVNSHTRQI